MRQCGIWLKKVWTLMEFHTIVFQLQHTMVWCISDFCLCAVVVTQSRIHDPQYMHCSSLCWVCYNSEFETRCFGGSSGPILHGFVGDATLRFYSLGGISAMQTAMSVM